MTKRIFISYRRDDSGGYAIALYAQLERFFGKGNVFFDVGDSIKPGTDFDQEIKKAVKDSDVLLALIGKNWLSISDSDGRRRVDNPKDYVNIEISTALKNKVLVIPVLLNETKMPSDTALPDNLKVLSKCQAVEIRHSHFNPDSEQLMFNLGVGKVMSKIGETLPEQEGVYSAQSNLLEVRNINCPNCRTLRDSNLKLPCPLCGSRSYFSIGYIYPHEAKVAILALWLIPLMAILSGVLYMIITSLK